MAGNLKSTGAAFTDEEFRPVIGYEAQYSVSRSGRIVSNKFPGREKEVTTTALGERIVVLFKDGVPKTFTISRLIADAFGVDTIANKQARLALRRIDATPNISNGRNVGCKCVELGITFPSIIAASKECRIDYSKLRKSLGSGEGLTSKPMRAKFGLSELHFEKVEQK